MFVRERFPFGDSSLESSKHLSLVLPLSARGSGGRYLFLASLYILLVPGKGSLVMSKVDGRSKMGYYFDRDDASLLGFSKHFKDQSLEELGHTEKLMKYQNKRGGRIVLKNIEVYLINIKLNYAKNKKPEKDDSESSRGALEAALALEKSVNQNLLDLRQLAEKYEDFQDCHGWLGCSPIWTSNFR
ncbi:soma ferritin [Trichonephila clavipes]|nr:soma ferritin [Trichonephila clavipes]